jgi:hypothetical protein
MLFDRKNMVATKKIWLHPIVELGQGVEISTNIMKDWC